MAAPVSTLGTVGLTLAEGFWHRLWFGARDSATSRIGGGGLAEAAPQSDYLYMVIFWISMVSFIFLMVLMVLFTVQYRRRPGVPIQRSPAHNTPLELTWTVVPLIALVWIFFEGFWGYIGGQTGGSLPEEISLTAQKWSWNLLYSNGAQSPEFVVVGTEPVPVLVAPAGMPVLLRMTSMDVIHSFWVPDFRWKQDVFPNRYTAFAFTASKIEDLDPALTQTGKHADGTEYRFIEHYIFCAEYCGDKHSEMAGVLRVLPPADYVKVVNDWAKPKGPPAAKGFAWYKIKGCISCHSIDGSNKTGPSWKDLYGNPKIELEGGGVVTADENYIRESIYEPAAKVHKGFPNQMVSFQGTVNQEQLSDIIAYMRSISVHTPPSLLDQPDGAPPADGAGEKPAEQPPPGGAGGGH
jgi:cytochrome c oxidase subunit II